MAIARKCSHCGADVVITGRDEEVLRRICDENKGLKYIVSDVTVLEAHDSFLESCEKILGGKCDTLVNNAGISLHEGWYDSGNAGKLG